MRRAQRDIDLRPELYTHYYKNEFPERFHAVMDTRSWGPGERIVFETYSKEVFEQSFDWIAEHEIFAEGTNGIRRIRPIDHLVCGGVGLFQSAGERAMRKQILACVLAAFGFGWGASAASGQETVKIGLIVPLTGGQASTGKQLDNAVKLYMRQHGDTVAGKKIEVIVRDDGAIPDNTKRIAQELIVNDKVQVIAGFGITPAALAAAPLATQAKIPQIVMLAGASIVTERSPYIVRTSFTLAQSAVIIGDWAPKNGIRKVATLTSDYAPGTTRCSFSRRASPPPAVKSSKRSRCP